ncbi:hypothetical protein IGI04_040845 [Brassica rapa subsp. trilocularis]|uniref:Bis(5'-adenosyl)-triphosphatase n=1 Tax=Brassica rapa subsp. trilocularis TaxID=1813537 RepID=A0ABQ7KPS8_BRACM|nr:hypothetical protein IGI04_040845 [Brassica rapa subsp. trilocularis]
MGQAQKGSWACEAHEEERGKGVTVTQNGDGGGAEMLKLQVSGKAILSTVRCRRQARVSGKAILSTMSTSSSFVFGPYKIDPREVFYATPLSYAMVNLRPLLPGHVLVCPRRLMPRFTDLTADETSDLWLTAQKVGSRIETFHNATSLTLAIQDGPQAGQSVPHVHIHVLPRKGGDFEKNDEIYDAIDEKEKELKQKLDLDKDRVDRSIEEMADEASQYRSLFDC